MVFLLATVTRVYCNSVPLQAMYSTRSFSSSDWCNKFVVQFRGEEGGWICTVVEFAYILCHHNFFPRPPPLFYSSMSTHLSTKRRGLWNEARLASQKGGGVWEWGQAHPTKRREGVWEWGQAHPTKRREGVWEWGQAHPTKRREIVWEWGQAHPTKRREIVWEWGQAHPTKRREEPGNEARLTQQKGRKNKARFALQKAGLSSLMHCMCDTCNWFLSHAHKTGLFPRILFIPGTTVWTAVLQI